MARTIAPSVLPTSAESFEEPYVLKDIGRGRRKVQLVEEKTTDKGSSSSSSGGVEGGNGGACSGTRSADAGTAAAVRAAVAVSTPLCHQPTALAPAPARPTRSKWRQLLGGCFENVVRHFAAWPEENGIFMGLRTATLPLSWFSVGQRQTPRGASSG